jgi:anti-sigma B factor antagonist
LVRLAERTSARPGPDQVQQGLTVEIEERKDALVISLAGELDVSTAPRFNAAMSDNRTRHARTVIVDLAKLQFMDSTGLSAVLVAEMHARTSHQRFVVVRGPRHVQELFRLTGVDHFLEVVDQAGAIAPA